MLVALLAALLLGSSGTSALLASFDHAQASIKTQIEDRDRRAALLSVVEDAQRAMKVALKSRVKTTEELVARLRSHEASAADIEPLLARLGADAQAAQEEMVRSRFELKGRMSREEWARMFPQAAGGLTLLIQNESPGKHKEANRLPAPKGPVAMFMRLYWPKAEAIGGKWTSPPLKRL